MRLSDKKMPLPLSGKMSVILPFILFLAPFGLFVISAMHRDPEECFGSFVVAKCVRYPYAARLLLPELIRQPSLFFHLR